MKFHHLRRTVLAAAALLSCLAAPAYAQTAGTPEFDAAVESYIRAHPEVLLETINRYAAEQEARKAEAEDNAFLQMSGEFFAGDLPILGDPNGAVTMVYVLDAACTYCRRMTPVVAEILEKNPDVKIVQHWVPFLTPASEYAGRVASLISERFPDKYAEYYHDLMLKTAGLTNDIVDSVVAQVLGADAAGVIRSDVMAGADSIRLAGIVQRNLDLASRGKVAGTPFFYIDGLGREGIYRGAVPANILQEGIDKARAIN